MGVAMLQRCSLGTWKSLFRLLASLHRIQMILVGQSMAKKCGSQVLLLTHCQRCWGMTMHAVGVILTMVELADAVSAFGPEPSISASRLDSRHDEEEPMPTMVQRLRCGRTTL